MLNRELEKHREEWRKARAQSDARLQRFCETRDAMQQYWQKQLAMMQYQQQIASIPTSQLPMTPAPFQISPDLTTTGALDPFKEDQEYPRATIYTAAKVPVQQKHFSDLIMASIHYHHECTNSIPDKIEINPLLMLFFSTIVTEYKIGEKSIPFVENDILHIDKIKCVTLPK